MTATLNWSTISSGMTATVRQTTGSLSGHQKAVGRNRFAVGPEAHMEAWRGKMLVDQVFRPAF